MTRLKRVAATLGAAALVAAPAVSADLAPVAEAHDTVIDAEPANGGTVDEFPRHIELMFSGRPKPNFNTVAVSNKDSKEILFSAEPKLDGQYISVDVPADVQPGPGNYIVGFQITSSDGHSTRGMTTFTVSGAESGTAAQGVVDDQQSAPEQSVPAWALIAGGGLVLLIIAVVAGVAISKKKG